MPETMDADALVQARLDSLRLSSECVDMKPVDYDWRDHGEDWEVAPELLKCPKCEDGQIECENCTDGQVECPECHGNPVDCPDCGGSGEEECEECGGSGTIEIGDGKLSECRACDGKGVVNCSTCDGTGQDECAACDGEGEVECPECHGDEYIDCDYEGCHNGELEMDGWEPMMDYYYPLPKSFSPDDDLHESLDNCTLIRLYQEERYVLALTGGGMDLSWQICATYIKLGYLPPAHFCDLPRMAQHHDDERKLILAACKRTMEIQVRDRQWVLDKLVQMQKDIEAGRL